MEGYHKSVLLREALDALGVKRDAWYIDCTLGDGGHSIEILRKGGKLVGIDIDPQALSRAQIRLESLGIDKIRYKLVQGNFREVKNLIYQQTDTKDRKFAGAIFDLGVSSLQLEAPERGFSFSKEGPLDMRMDPNLAVRALDLINALSRKELYELFKSLGEEKYSWALANSIVSARQVIPITTTGQLAALVEKSVRRKKGDIHPATRVFQALRIAVNDELGALQEGLDQVKDLIEKNGRVVVISFHSLEDRIVKHTFGNWEDERVGEVLTKKPVVPSNDEISMNPRSRSAKMRVFRFI